MGIPYSRQINNAFDQVTPLVAAGFKVLETTKNISIVLAAIQILTVIFLAFILAALIALLFTLNPDLVEERQALVTPVMRWIAAWILDPDSRSAIKWGVLVVFIGIVVGTATGLWFVRKSEAEALRRSIADGGLTTKDESEQ